MPFEVKFYIPKGEDGLRELAARVSDVHADFVISKIKGLDCPLEQKLALVDAIIQGSRNQRRV